MSKRSSSFEEDNPLKSPWYWFLGIVGGTCLWLCIKSYTGQIAANFIPVGWLIAALFLLLAHGMRSSMMLWRQATKQWEEAYEQLSLLSDLYYKEKLLIAPGDVIDKYTILQIKLEKIKDQKKIDFIKEELFRTEVLLNNIMAKEPENIKLKIKGLYNKLHKINREQWSWEDKVRTEQSWEAAIGARECNNRRVAVKSEINWILDYPCEVKEYKTC